MKKLTALLFAAICFSTPIYAADNVAPVKPTTQELEKQISDLNQKVEGWKALANSYRTKLGAAYLKSDDQDATAASQAAMNAIAAKDATKPSDNNAPKK